MSHHAVHVMQVIVKAQGRPGHGDIEMLWAQRESAKSTMLKGAQEAVSRTGGVGSSRSRGGKLSKLEAAMKRAADEGKAAARKLPRSERDTSVANAR